MISNIDRCLAVGITNAIPNMCNIFAVAAFPHMVDHLGHDGAFLTFSMVSVIMVVWGQATIKDVDSLSLVEVENLFEAGEKKKTGTRARQS